MSNAFDQLRQWSWRLFTFCLCTLGLMFFAIVTIFSAFLLDSEMDKAEKTAQAEGRQRLEVAVKSQRLYHAFVAAADSTARIEAANTFNAFIDSLRTDAGLKD